MKRLPVFALLALLFGGSSAFAAKPAAPAAAPAPVPAPAAPATPANTQPIDSVPLPQPAPVEAAPTLKFDDYFNELVGTLKLTDAEKKKIEAVYTADGGLVKNTLNNDSLSPLQKAQQVADLRGVRNGKIEVILVEVARIDAFHKLETRYRVALTDLAAVDGWAVTPPPAK